MGDILRFLYALADMGLGDYTVWEIIDKIEHQRN